MLYVTNESNELESWLWEAACSIGGEIDTPKFKGFVLLIVFFKSISDVFDDELKNIDSDKENAELLKDIEHFLLRFYIPKGYRWLDILSTTGNLGEFLTDVSYPMLKHVFRSYYPVILRTREIA